jgi:hypothetical protein
MQGISASTVVLMPAENRQGTRRGSMKGILRWASLALALAALGGCIVAPAPGYYDYGYGYGGGYAPGYAYAPAPVYVYPPPVAVGFGFGFGGHRRGR